MIVVHVIFKVSADAADRFAEMLAENAAASIDREPGCRRFDVWTDPDRRGEFLLYELYDTRADFDAHLEAPHFKQFDAACAEFAPEKSVTIYRAPVYETAG